MKFTVSGMTCGGCINAITRAIQLEDSQAKVQVDLVTQTIKLETHLTANEAQRLIEGAGFPVIG